MIKSRCLKYIVVGLILLVSLKCQSQSLWDLANEQKELLKIATLFTAQNVRDHLGTEEGINKAMDWCRKTALLTFLSKLSEADIPQREKPLNERNPDLKQRALRFQAALQLHRSARFRQAGT